MNERNFGQDAAFLAQHVETIVLSDESGDAQVAVVPAYQGRVMTSTAGGEAGDSYGWINYELIGSGEIKPHIMPYGGEERFWLGPEGGQFAIFFEPGEEFTFENWQTPAVIDTEAFEVVERTPRSVSFQREANLTNYSGTPLHFRIDRKVSLLDRQSVDGIFGVNTSGLQTVAYETHNRLTNTGDAAWTREGGMLSIWLLGMYKSGPDTTVVIPYRNGSDTERGPIVNSAYFGEVPPDRLKVGEGVIYFKGDGQLRSKIGLSPRRSTPIAGSWDPARGVLTLVRYNQPGPHVTAYINSMWEMQERPYAGDVINSYNDGPTGLGEPFYEIETSSPALALEPGASGVHIQQTMHLTGDRPQLDTVARKVLGVSLDQIEAAF